MSAPVSLNPSRLPWQREGVEGLSPSGKQGMCVLLPWSQILHALPPPANPM